MKIRNYTRCKKRLKKKKKKAQHLKFLKIYEQKKINRKKVGFLE